jgi:uncharacterized protein
MSAIAMRFNVAQLLKEPVGASRQHEIEDHITGIDSDLEPVKPLVGKVRFLRTSDGILVTGRLHTEVLASCRRCLQTFDVPVDFDLEEEFRPSVDVSTGAVVSVGIGDSDHTTIDAHHMLDLSEVVRQNLVLAIPMSPLCSSHCRGLCPGCGADLNLGPCTCRHQEGDPRLEALREQM